MQLQVLDSTMNGFSRAFNDPKVMAGGAELFTLDITGIKPTPSRLVLLQNLACGQNVTGAGSGNNDCNLTYGSGHVD